MAVRVRPIALWRAEVDNQPGTLARTLEPLASAGSNLQVIMGYGLPGGRSAIEVSPISGARATAAAQRAGLTDGGIAALSIEGDDRAGLVHAIASSLAEAGINMAFLVANASRGRFTSVIGFESREAADRAAPLVKKAATGARRSPARRATARGRKTARKTARKSARKSRKTTRR
jgi:hypothetical protein